MTISLSILFTLLTMHYICDFLLQSDKMAKGKSSSMELLTLHVTAYSIPFALMFGPLYGAVNFFLHMLVDFFTSRVTKKLFAKNEHHWAFAVIGFDQLLHYACLIGTVSLVQFGGVWQALGIE